jgi:hypothetical protein
MKLVGFLVAFFAFFVHSVALWFGHFARSMSSPRAIYQRSTWRCVSAISAVSLMQLTLAIRFISLLPAAAFFCLVPPVLLLLCWRYDSSPPKAPLHVACASVCLLTVITFCSPAMSELPFSFPASETAAFLFLAGAGIVILSSALLLKKAKFLIVLLLGTSLAAILISLTLLARAWDAPESKRLLYVLALLALSLLGHFYGLGELTGITMTAARFSAASLIYATVVAAYAAFIDNGFAGVAVGWAVAGWTLYWAVAFAGVFVTYGLWPSSAGGEIPEAEHLLTHGLQV